MGFYLKKKNQASSLTKNVSPDTLVLKRRKMRHVFLIALVKDNGIT